MSTDLRPLLVNLLANQRQQESARAFKERQDQRRLLFQAATDPDVGLDEVEMRNLAPLASQEDFARADALNKLSKAAAKKQKAQAEVRSPTTGQPGTLAQLGALAQTPNERAAFTNRLQSVLQAQGATTGEQQRDIVNDLAAGISQLGAEARADLQSDLRRESRLRSRNPLAAVNARKARILLKIAEGEEVSENDRKFLDELQRLDPLDVLRRNALKGVDLEGGTPTQENPNATSGGFLAPILDLFRGGEPAKTATQKDVNRVERELKRTMGRKPTAREIADELERQGFEVK